jgi:hypothetical protein
MGERQELRRPLVRRFVAFGGGALLLMFGALAVLLLTTHDAHALSVDPPSDVPVVTPIVEPVVETVSPDVEPVVDTITPVVDPVVDTITPIVQPAVDTITPVVEPVAGTVTPIVQPLPSVPDVDVADVTPRRTTAAALATTDDGVPSVAAPPTSSSEVRVPPLPHVPGNGFVRPRGLASATFASALLVAPGNAPLPAPLPEAPPVLQQPVVHSSSSSLDGGHGLQLLLLAIAAVLGALYLARGRRVLPSGAVMPRNTLVSLIERPG